MIMENPTIAMGAFAEDLQDQLKKQGIPFEEAKIEHINKDMRACSRLSVRGIITPSVADKTYDKIAKALWKALA